jgi:protein-tyrosine phosphatase
VRQFSEWLVAEGLVHFVATDAHGTQVRPPLLKAAYDRIYELADESTALDLCLHNPTCVIQGRDVPGGKRATLRHSWHRWWSRRRLKQFD